MPSPPDRTALYRLYDAAGRLLYIGIAKDPKRRWSQHALEKADSWWPDVASKTVEWLDSRKAAEEAELRAIEKEGPPYNKRDVKVWDFSTGTSGQRKIPSPHRQQQIFAYRQKCIQFMNECVNAKISAPEMIARRLRERIISGVYPVGSRLPAARVLGCDFGVSPPTFSRGVGLLKDEGLLEFRPGHGTFVVALPQ